MERRVQQSYILTAGNRKVTPTLRPLFLDDVLFIAPAAPGLEALPFFPPGRYFAVLDKMSGFLEWVSA